jgi:hypothetical protein
MSERSAYLEDQANKCRSHANAISDRQTKGELRKQADEYNAQAIELQRTRTFLSS